MGRLRSGDVRVRCEIPLTIKLVRRIVMNGSADNPLDSTDQSHHGIPKSNDRRSDLFRREALKHYYGTRSEGDILRISPRWTDIVYWFLLAAFIVALAYGIFGHLNEYASGPAVVCLSDHTEVNALKHGTVESVHVGPGVRVKKGDVLIRFHSMVEQDQLDRLNAEFELELVRMLRDPQNSDAKAALARLRADKVFAKAQLEECIVRAPREGIVHDIRIRAGQPMNAGDRILSIVHGNVSYKLVAFIPGHFRPLLRVGQSLRLEVKGYSHAYVNLTMTHVGDEVIGPYEARRFLGPEIGDAIPIAAAVVLVEAELRDTMFESEGKLYPYFNGMQGMVDISVRDESVIVALFPGLRRLTEKIHD